MLQIRETTLREARTKHMRDIYLGPTKCPCCGRTNQARHRKFNAGMAYSMIQMYHLAGTAWVTADEIDISREEDKIAAYGLLVKDTSARRPDGGRSPGKWRLTEKGEQFVLARLSIPSHAWWFDSRCVELDDDKMITIRQAAGSTFDYDELMKDRKVPASRLRAV